VGAVRTIIVAFIFSGLYVLMGALFFLGDPGLRFVWVMASLFVVFYALSAMTNYSAAARFGYLVAITIPLWDSQVSAEVQVEDTLWAVGAISFASVITALIELIFAHLKPRDDLVQSISERLARVEAVLNASTKDGRVDEQTRKEIARLSILGTSRLRRIVQRASGSPHYGEEMGAIVVLTGRLVDLAANLAHLEMHFPADSDRQAIGGLADTITSIRSDLLNGRVPRPVAFESDSDTLHTIPLLREMQRSVSLISDAFADSQSLQAYIPSPSGFHTARAFLAPDAFSNPKHIKFGLSGCLAAGLCYFGYNAVDWPGISTALTTCVVTALTTIGSSHQKQILRFAGALVGGVVMGIGAQIFILPNLDSIAGFTTLFLAVTMVAAWFATSSPRLSYFGTQIAISFYLINLQEFRIQTSLAVARDRIVGVLLGLFAMWLVFDHLWAAPAAVEMKKTFASTLRLLAQFAREPLSRDYELAVQRSSSLRETINTSFNQVRALADGVLLEFGSSRQQDLALRNQIVQWQPQLTIVFLTRIALLKYRLGVPGFELPEETLTAQQGFDESLAQTLDGMADRIEGKALQRRGNLESSLERLERLAELHASREPTGIFAAQMQTFLYLSRRIESLTLSLDKEI
jgi:multidrug resistance protein MdtO